VVCALLSGTLASNCGGQTTIKVEQRAQNIILILASGAAAAATAARSVVTGLRLCTSAVDECMTLSNLRRASATFVRV